MPAPAVDRERLAQIRRSIFGSRLRQIRVAKGLTQAEVATRAHLGRTFYNQLEGGKHSTTIDRLWDLADALDVQVADLFREPR